MYKNREITFQNAEELTEEGMPFMILFYDPNNTAPIKDYKSLVESELISEKREHTVNYKIFSIGELIGLMSI